MNVEQLLTMPMAQAFKEEGRYEGIVPFFTSGDTAVAGCTLAALDKLMEKEDALTSFMESSTQPPSAKRGAAKTPTPDPPKETPPAMQVAYPPTKSNRWKLVQNLIDSKAQCPICFSDYSFHLEHGCPAIAHINKVLVDNESKAKSILEAYASRPKKDNKRGGRGG